MGINRTEEVSPMPALPNCELTLINGQCPHTIETEDEVLITHPDGVMRGKTNGKPFTSDGRFRLAIRPLSGGPIVVFNAPHKNPTKGHLMNATGATLEAYTAGA